MDERCQCPSRGVPDHDGPCPNRADRTVRRGDVVLRLCHMCDLSGDVRIDPLELD